MIDNTDKEFTILTIGWFPTLIDRLFIPIEHKTKINFIHCLMDNPESLNIVKEKYPNTKFISILKEGEEFLTKPDYKLLASIESFGVPTIKSMILGDPYIRNRSDSESFGYATFLARSFKGIFQEIKPDVVLASNDQIHSGISLAIAKSMNIPWVAMAFTSIPDNLTSFCCGLTPDTIIPIPQQVNEKIKNDAKSLIDNVLSGKQQVMAYRAPNSFWSRAKMYGFHATNFIKRMISGPRRGVDRYTAPTIWERTKDISRRSLNNLTLPLKQMLNSPPKGRYIYFPLHMSPESMVDTWAPFYQDQMAFIRQLSYSIPADVELVVKLHFSDPYNYSFNELKNLMDHYHVQIANPFVPSRPFLEGASLVVGITGTSNFEAAIRGIPVLIFGNSPYQHFPRTERALRPHELYDQIQRMLKMPVPSKDEIIESVSVFISRYMPGQINDWNRPYELDELEKYADCYSALAIYLQTPGIKENWYKQPPFKE